MLSARQPPAPKIVREIFLPAPHMKTMDAPAPSPIQAFANGRHGWDRKRRAFRLRAVLLGTGSFLLLGHVALSIASGPALDRLAKRNEAPANPTAQPGYTFPGSAYFYAQDAYTPLATGSAAYSPHVTMLRPSIASLPPSAYIGLTAQDRYRALNCLTSAIYYEAANEPTEGQRAVAQVVLNRVRHPSWPNSVCGVVYQGSERSDLLCQFTFSCDGSMLRPLVFAKWQRARRIAQIALSGQTYAPVGLATYYHTLAVFPGWAPKLDPVTIVGAHIFYQMRGTNGRPQAFSMRYSGREMLSGPIRRPWKPIPVGDLPIAMPYLPASQPIPAQGGPAPAARPGPLGEPPRPFAAPGNGGGGAPSGAQPDRFGDHLPYSDIRPEYRNSGHPLD